MDQVKNTTIEIPLSIEKQIRTVRQTLDYCVNSYEKVIETLQDINKQLISEKAITTRLKAVLTPEQLIPFDAPDKKEVETV